MSSNQQTIFELARNADVSHPLFVENYAWIDKQLFDRFNKPIIFKSSKRDEKHLHLQSYVGKRKFEDGENKKSNKRQKVSHDFDGEYTVIPL